MIPESKLIRSELIIRELALTDDVMLARKSLVRWLALSLGLISPNESRRLLIDTLDILLLFHGKNQPPTSKDVIAELHSSAGNEDPPSDKAVYYHLKRLVDGGVIFRKDGRYYFSEEGLRPAAVMKEAYLRKLDKTFENIDKALDKLKY